MADTASGPEGSKSEAGPKSGAGPAGKASPDGASAEDESRRKFREALERKRAKEADPGRGRDIGAADQHIRLAPSRAARTQIERCVLADEIAARIVVVAAQ